MSLVRNVLRLKYRLGLFDNPYVTDLTAQEYYAPDHLAAAQRTAEESAVLLTNNGILPLNENVTKIALVGPMADAKHDQNGTWCFDMEKARSVTPLEAFTEIYGKDNVKYAPGLKSTRDKSEALFDEAVAAAEGADVIVYCAGEEAVLSGEAHCRADITLPGAQTSLLNRLKATGKPVVLVVMAGRPLALVPETETADATLYTFHGGTMAGPAIANLLTGKANPSGKLPRRSPGCRDRCLSIMLSTARGVLQAAWCSSTRSTWRPARPLPAAPHFTLMPVMAPLSPLDMVRATLRSQSPTLCSRL